MRSTVAVSTITAALVAGALGVGVVHVTAGQSRTLPSNFVYLADIDPSIEQDMRYATPHNFTGGVVNGYKTGECILTRSTAEALSRAQRKLAERHPGHSLKVYDCYRPVRAVSRFAAWSRAPGGGSVYYHPAIARSRLFALGYIASQSGHSRGNVVDLTIVKVAEAVAPKPAEAGDALAPLPPAEKGEPSPAKPGGESIAEKLEAGAPSRRGSSCIAAMPATSSTRELDMGTDFDCFDARSNTYSAGVGAGPMRARRMLLDVMGSAGFSNFSKEWWHFSYSGGAARQAHDFVVEPRALTPRERTDAPR